jgi:hypothetical protein
MLPFEEQVAVDLLENQNRGRDDGVQQEGPEDELQTCARPDGVNRPKGVAGESLGTEGRRSSAHMEASGMGAGEVVRH